ncbi:hypothetical protein CFC21_005338 [Triticum aestivum]|uniref:KIB1-4 beta-propeller domain-containing protein n=3 Tax=Triticum aestivum TaxID=4565 RepID=A0A9R1D9F7_WHEAT|nr:hypothetical protein CFC21_005338 [Triticum aestivum]
MFMRELEIPDLVRSGAVCVSWHAVYLAVRRHRFPLPIPRNQLPCLLYACRDSAADGAVVRCPFTGDSVQVPLPLPPLTRHSTVGSAHGWLVTADEASNLHLLNPITGAHAALPPITTLHHVESCTDAEGRLTYNVRAVIRSRSPLTLARPGTACTTVSPSPAARRLEAVASCCWCTCRTASSLTPGSATSGGRGSPLTTTSSWASAGASWTLSTMRTKIMRRDRKGKDPSSMYILQAPWGDILQIWRWRSYTDSSTPVELPRDLLGHNEDEIDRYIELRTTEIEVYKVDLENQALVKLTSLANHALFLDYNSTMCFATKDFPALKPNCVYITDDSLEYVNMCNHNWREIGVWDIENKSLQTFDSDLLTNSWMNWPSPVWITPSLF